MSNKERNDQKIKIRKNDERNSKANETTKHVLASMEQLLELQRVFNEKYRS